MRAQDARHVCLPLRCAAHAQRSRKPAERVSALRLAVAVRSAVADLRRWNPPQLKPQLKHTASPRAPPGTSRTRKSAMAEAVHLFETAVRHNIKACHSACATRGWLRLA